jgi:ATP-dependent RNA helicase DeaD
MGGVQHLMVYAGSDDAAADLADTLTLHGFVSGAPGESDVPIWVGVDALEARAVLAESEAGSVAVVSAQVPADPDTLDRRHGGGQGGWVLVEPREMPHMLQLAARTGYRCAEVAAKPARPSSGDLQRLLATVERSMANLDVEAYQIVLEPLYGAYGAERVAAALLGALRSRPEQFAPAVSKIAGPGSEPVAGAGASTGGLVKLFVSTGSRDGLRPGDLVGAIIGEAGIAGEQIGRIDIRDTFSRVEVAREVADKVVRALNGKTIRGRAVRVDLDRAERGGPGGPGGAGPRGGGPGGRPGGAGPRGGGPGGRPGGAGPRGGGPGGRPGGAGPRGGGPRGGGSGPRRSGPRS